MPVEAEGHVPRGDGDTAAGRIPDDLLVEAVVDVLAGTATGEQAFFPHQPEVVADGGLGQVEMLAEHADIQLAVAQELQDLEASGFGQHAHDADRHIEIRR